MHADNCTNNINSIKSRISPTNKNNSDTSNSKPFVKEANYNNNVGIDNGNSKSGLNLMLGVLPRTTAASGASASTVGVGRLGVRSTHR